MKFFEGTFFASLLVMTSLTTSVVYADAVNCPTAQPIRDFAQTLSVDDFQVDGPGIAGNWLFEVKRTTFTVKNREWHLGAVVHGNNIEKIEQARKLALQTVKTLAEGTVANMIEIEGGYVCMYQTKHGGLMLASQDKP